MVRWCAKIVKPDDSLVVTTRARSNVQEDGADTVTPPQSEEGDEEAEYNDDNLLQISKRRAMIMLGGSRGMMILRQRSPVIRRVLLKFREDVYYEKGNPQPQYSGRA
ncbi:hypothetical protein HAX54_036755 [Datura stramonium]|uniref:Uncharacterized protein n=1 Tax=Datura stramonium TaxID=4076 RepID=A0ABS8VIK0_DATST|nr:hypothetical protein [Datura stramonium]